MTITRARELDRVFNDFFYGGRTEYTPVYDAVENDNHYVLTFELPGISEDSINLEVKDRLLKISVKKEDSTKQDNVKYLVRNRNSIEFEKSFKLPDDVNNEEVTANLNNGLLTLTINKREEAQPKKINIKS